MACIDLATWANGPAVFFTSSLNCLTPKYAELLELIPSNYDCEGPLLFPSLQYGLYGALQLVGNNSECFSLTCSVVMICFVSSWRESQKSSTIDPG
jgi:hypothetical protein